MSRVDGLGVAIEWVHTEGCRNLHELRMRFNNNGMCAERVVRGVCRLSQRANAAIRVCLVVLGGG